jgi:hypothetical protein
MLLRTAKSCGPDAPTLASSSRRLSRPYRAQTEPYSRATVAKEPGHRRARRKPLKPLRAGMPGDSGVLVVTRVRFTNAKCTRGRGCSGHPAFPTPLLGGTSLQSSGASRREARSCVLGRGRGMRSPDAAQRAALAAWCAADPGSILHSASPWVTALRSSVKNAAPRPGHEARCLTGSRDDGFAFEQR